MNRRIAVWIASLLIVPCSADLIIVDTAGPAQYQTIQEAINNSRDGDTIVVKPGTYSEQVGFNGRRVTVRSENPNDPAVVEATVITGGTRSSVFFDFGEGRDSVLEGFTITGQGIFCAGTSPTISKNVIRDSATSGITGESDATPAIVGNTITSSQQEGIYGCNGPIQGNTVSQNRGGIAYCDGDVRDNIVSNNRLEGVYACDGLIEGNTISRNSAGVGYCNGLIRDNWISANGDAGGLYYCNAQIIGNAIVDNIASSEGGGLFSCHGSILNNVIAGNRADTDGGGLYDCAQLIGNNTIVGNVAGARGGALNRCPGTLSNNIIAYNEAMVAGGIYGPSDNSYNAFWTNTGGNFGGDALSGRGDQVVNPGFAADGHWDRNGTAQTEDDLWIHGDYHLKSQAGRWDPEARQWVADSVTSPCIDEGDPGSNWSAELWPHGLRINLGAYGGTPAASWSPSEVGFLADLNQNGQIGPDDLEQLAAAWLLEEDLLAADLNRDGVVDLHDFVILGRLWGTAPPPPSPPTPDPMTWDIDPYGTSPYSIAMVATTAVSTDGTGIEYYFENAFYPTTNSGWVVFAGGQEPRWEVTELAPNSMHWFQVKARNRGNLLETGWSDVVPGMTLREDFTAPTPNPMTWETRPYGSASDTIRMVATEAVDPSGVEYKFTCTSHPQYTSSWQGSPTYEVTPVPHGRYTFIVQARDKSAARSTTASSVSATADMQPPTPDPMQWEVEPYEVKLGGDLEYGATMTAVQAIDDVEGVEYFFECTTRSGFSSGWQTSREYTVLLGRRAQGQRFRVKARDTSSSHNETGWSSEVIAR